MPELPEVETIRRHLEQALVGASIARAEFPERIRRGVSSAELDAFCRQRSISAVRRRAKYLLIVFDHGDALLIHLGMTGRFVLGADNKDALPNHTRAFWKLNDGRTLYFCDPRRFGQMRLCHGDCQHHWPEALAALGPEPLSRAFTGASLFELTQSHRYPIKTLIMDQRHVVGVGNIYASEALFRASIAPQCPASQLDPDQCRRLARAIKAVLREAIAAGGTTISDFRTLDGSEGGFSVHLRVYDRVGQPCRRCKQGIQRIVIGGRSSFFCPQCQPLPPAAATTGPRRCSPV